MFDFWTSVQLLMYGEKIKKGAYFSTLKSPCPTKEDKFIHIQEFQDTLMQDDLKVAYLFILSLSMCALF
jgi:hypothetical protein